MSDAPTSVLQNHHKIAKSFLNNELIQMLVQNDSFSINEFPNLIYLPSSPNLASQLGISAHNGGPLSSYTNLIHPLILYDLKNPAKRATFCNHFGEARHKREQALLWHRWNEFI